MVANADEQHSLHAVVASLGFCGMSVEAPFEWDDVGSWQALPRLIGSNEQGNSIAGLHVGVGTSNCIIKTTEDHLVVTAGLSDCIVVHPPPMTLFISPHVAGMGLHSACVAINVVSLAALDADLNDG